MLRTPSTKSWFPYNRSRSLLITSDPKWLMAILWKHFPAIAHDRWYRKCSNLSDRERPTTIIRLNDFSNPEIVSDYFYWESLLLLLRKGHGWFLHNFICIIYVTDILSVNLSEISSAYPLHFQISGCATDHKLVFVFIFKLIHTDRYLNYICIILPSTDKIISFQDLRHN